MAGGVQMSQMPISHLVGSASDLLRFHTARAALVPHIGPGTLASFERVLHGRQGVAIAQAVDERCTVCLVRLRPQVFYEVRKNESVVQCDSCQRILYYVPPKPADAQSA